MKYLLIIILCLFSGTQVPIHAYGVQDFNSCQEIVLKETPVKPLKKSKKKQKRTASANTPLYLIKAALIISAAVGLIILFLIFQPVFIFAIVFFLAFLWVISGFAASMSFVMMLIRGPSNLREQNEELAAYVFLYMFSRILLLVLLFIFADFIIALIVAISFVPAFIVHILLISMLLSTHKTKNSEKDMFSKKTEKVPAE